MRIDTMHQVARKARPQVISGLESDRESGDGLGLYQDFKSRNGASSKDFKRSGRLLSDWSMRIAEFAACGYS
jgi:hypothetical protein